MHIPKVVILEALRHYERETAAVEKEVRKVWARLDQFQVDFDPKYQQEALQKLRQGAAEYETLLRTKLAAGQVVLLPLPNVSHDNLLDRDLGGRKPFSPTGKGYRDALIWGSIVELGRQLTETDTLIFVTNNRVDFCCGDKTALASELLTDLPKGLQVLWYPDLKSMLDKREWPTEAPPTPDLADEPTLTELIQEAVASACDRLIGSELDYPPGLDQYSRGLNFDFGDAPLPMGLETVSIESIEPDFNTLDWQIVETLSGDTQLAKVYVDADVVLDGYMPHAEYYAREDSVQAHDVDWNKHYAWVYVERPLRLTFDMIMYPELGTIENIEFASATGHLPYADEPDGSC